MSFPLLFRASFLLGSEEINPPDITVCHWVRRFRELTGSSAEGNLRALWRLGSGFCVLVLIVVTGRMRETNGIFVAGLRSIGHLRGGVRPYRARAADREAQAEDSGEAGNGGMVAGGPEDPRGNG